MKKELTSKAILFDFGRALLDIEYGIIATFAQLFTHPERVIADYFTDRKYFHPLKYLAVVLILYSWAGMDGFMSVSGIKGSKKSVPEIVHYFPYVWTIITAGMATLLYKKDGLIFGEHLVIHCYLFAQTMILYLLLKLLPFKFLAFVNVPSLIILSIIFYGWGYIRYLKKPFKYHLYRLLGTWGLSAILIMVIGALILFCYMLIFNNKGSATLRFE
jgi:hypothetical protein